MHSQKWCEGSVDTDKNTLVTRRLACPTVPRSLSKTERQRHGEGVGPQVSGWPTIELRPGAPLQGPLGPCGDARAHDAQKGGGNGEGQGAPSERNDAATCGSMGRDQSPKGR